MRWPALASIDIRTATNLIAKHGNLAIGMIAQIVQYGAGLAVIPFMVTRLSPAEVGIWYVFVTVQGLAIILDFGFQPTFARAFALGYAGAKSLPRHGVGDVVATGQEPNWHLIAQALYAAQRIYRWFALGGGVVLLGGGLFYVSALARRGGLAIDQIQIAWTIFAVAIVFNTSIMWISPLLLATNRIRQNYIYLIMARGGAAVIGIFVLLAGGKLIALACASAVAIVAGRVLGAFMLREVTAETRCRSTGDPGTRRAIITAIWPNASRLGVVAIAGFLINRYSLFAISTLLGVVAASGYAISLQLFGAVSAFAQLPMQIAVPSLVASHAQADKSRLRIVLLRCIAAFILIFVTGATFVITIVPLLLTAIGSRTALLSMPEMSLLAGVLLLEGLHLTAAIFITSANEVPFTRSALISGGAVAIGATIAIWAGLGIMGMIAWQGLVQLSYNNWRWPLLAWKKVKPV
jgi:O-antigen/teichoic acid export membrane protein